ncbi:monooxygenase [Thermostaphylospora chromogena]|uniref:Acyl-CoA dehydrogenase n=1 Tax=Thermostaphylospora chromogena TaxID=35622 RepID=A0A1H1I8E5_9ACTN|nr:monooxygenase [Thermostaphylospora chromogena]SDR33606.1 hypothetical protein SAMN04489764_5305 [Thermostaphylospora chromogena]
MTDSLLTDPTIREGWSGRSPVDSEEGWLHRAAEVAGLLAAGAADRDVTLPPHAEVALLKDSGLVTLLGPVEHGGGGASWPTAVHVVRLISEADGRIGEILAYHYVLVWFARFIGTDEKIEHIDEVAAKARWLFGGAADLRSFPLTVEDAGEEMIFTGRIWPAIGAGVSDITMLEGLRPGAEVGISALAMSSHTGLSTWTDPRTPDAPGVIVDAADIPWSGALGHVAKRFQPRLYNGYLIPTLHLALANVRIGLLRAALNAVVAADAADGRPEHLNEAIGRLWAAEAFADDVAARSSDAHRNSRAVTQADLDDYRARVGALRVIVKSVLQEALDGFDTPALDRFKETALAFAARWPDYPADYGPGPYVLGRGGLPAEARS